jgi:hypothetical protein
MVTGQTVGEILAAISFRIAGHSETTVKRAVASIPPATPLRESGADVVVRRTVILRLNVSS